MSRIYVCQRCGQIHLKKVKYCEICYSKNLKKLEMSAKEFKELNDDSKKQLMIENINPELTADHKDIKRFKYRIYILLFCLSALITFSSYEIGSSQVIQNSDKIAGIKEYMSTLWLYRDQFDDLNNVLDEKAAFGMTSFEFDPYTEYFSPIVSEEYNQSIDVAQVGIGVGVIARAEGGAEITKVFKNSPAYDSGLRRGDVFWTVEGVNVFNTPYDDFKTLVLGDEGTIVSLQVKRKDQIIDIEVLRQYFSASIYGEPRDNYYYLSLTSFGSQTAEDCKPYLGEMKELGLKNIIIDLRGNSGGYLTSVTNISNLFIPKNKVIVKIEDSAAESGVYTTNKDAYIDLDKIIIVVNGQTASASEVFTLAMKENLDNVTIVGQTTYGKGVMQSQLPLADGSFLKLTTGRWVSSEGVWLNGEGITPDVYAEESYVYGLSFFLNSEIGLDTLKLGDKHTLIHSFKNALSLLGYNIENLNDEFDVQFKNELIKLQKQYGLNPNGELNDDTEYLIIKKIIYKKSVEAGIADDIIKTCERLLKEK